MGAKGEFDRIAVSGRSRLELIRSRRRMCRHLIRVIDEALVEVVAASVHHHIDGVEMSGDAGVELVGMDA